MWRSCTLLDDLPSIFDMKDTTKSISKRMGVRSDELSPELLYHALDGDRYGSRRIQKQFHAIVITI